MLHGEERSTGPRGGADLEVDVLHVVLGGAPGDDEVLRDLPVRETTGDEPEHLDLAFGQAGRPRATCPGALAGDVEDRRNGVTVEPARPCLAPQSPGGLGGSQRPAVWPLLDEAPILIGRRQDP